MGWDRVEGGVNGGMDVFVCLFVLKKLSTGDQLTKPNLKILQFRANPDT